MSEYKIIAYGAMCDIEEQLNGYGLTLGKDKELIDKLHFGLVINHIHGTLIESAYNKALEKLNKMVWKTAKKLGEVTP